MTRRVAGEPRDRAASYAPDRRNPPRRRWMRAVRHHARSSSTLCGRGFRSAAARALRHRAASPRATMSRRKVHFHWPNPTAPGPRRATDRRPTHQASRAARVRRVRTMQPVAAPPRARRGSAQSHRHRGNARTPCRRVHPTRGSGSPRRLNRCDRHGPRRHCGRSRRPPARTHARNARIPRSRRTAPAPRNPRRGGGVAAPGGRRCAANPAVPKRATCAKPNAKPRRRVIAFARGCPDASAISFDSADRSA